MIQIRRLRKKYDRKEALRGIDLELRPGRITGIVGPNACGKTTLMKCLLGLSLPDSGSITMFGREIDADAEFRTLLGYMPQNAEFPANLAAAELFMMLEALRARSAPRKAELIEYFSLGAFLNKALGTLSGGTCQKVAATAALMFDPPVLLLDEPTAGMDPIASLGFKSLLRKEAEQGKTIALVSHLLPEVEELAAEIVFLHEGEVIFAGTLSSLMAETRQHRLDEALIHLFERKLKAEQ